MKQKLFEQQMIKLLEADELEDPLAGGPDGDAAAVEAGMDDMGPGPEGFSDTPGPPVPAPGDTETGRATGKLNDWIGRIEEFIEYLNGLSPDSMNYELNRADCSTIMADVQRSESKKISRVAQDLSSLSEALKQYLLGAERKQREAESNLQGN